MKLTLLTIALLILTFGSTSSAQSSSMKLFDPVAITYSDQTVPWEYDYSLSFSTTEVYLTCPANSVVQATISGPNGGNLIIDNFITMNGANVCPWNCFGGVFTSPFELLGQPAGSAYIGIAPIDVSSQITGPGVYTFNLMDYGGAYGSSEVYLNTNCALESTNQVCHRNNGRSGSRTLTIGESAVAAHLAHGDTAGPCSNGN